MRKTWSIPLGFLLVATSAAQAQFTYTTNNGTITITGYTGSGGAVTIPNSINGLRVTSIAAYAISDFFHTALTVTIPGGVTSIGDYAFEFNYNLSIVLFEGNAPSIGSHVFFSDTLFGGTQTAYYLAGTTGWGSTLGAGVPTKALSAITITATPTNGLAPLTVSFASAGVDGNGNTITSWNWDFGDGSTSTVQNPSHTYANPGTFPVVLIGNSNNNGISSSGAAASIIVSPITTGFTANPTNGIVPLVVSFTSPAIDRAGDTITNWNWDFGDGSTSTVQNPSHSFTVPGTFSLALRATNNFGYPVIGTGLASITVSPSTLAFTANPTHGVVPLTVSFTSPTVDSGGSAITSWNWDFGDGSSSTAQNPSHSYITPGAFSPALIVTNNIDLTVTGTGPASITVSPLTIAFTATPTNGLEPLMVSFTSPGVDNGSNPITSWNWDFGDGSTSIAQNPSHSYTKPGTFFVALISSNNIGFTVTSSGPEIKVSPLTVAYAATPTNGAFPLAVNFTAAGVDDGGHAIISWNWDFGDGVTSTAQNPSHTYTNAATFSVALMATNNLGLAVIGSGPASVTVLLQVPQHTSFTVLHTFSGSDGANPYAGLILSGNMLYGTTSHSISPPNGTVFSLNNATLSFVDLLHFSVFNPPGVENYEGANPEARLILSGGTLLGTALLGGQDGNGNVFSLNIQVSPPKLTALHYFIPGAGGLNPSAGLVLAGNTLFGTTSGGGSQGYGTVFSLSSSGSAFTTLHSFSGGNDGATPLGDLIISGDTLYGTANKGGSQGYGTVFSLSTSGSNFTRLYSFTGGADGAYPSSGGLLLWSNVLYGVANQGGGNGYGTVFKVSTTGSNFTRLYSFTGSTDGAYPGASLIVSGETLYGVASGGGVAGNGTIYSLGLSSQVSDFTTLYSFTATNGASGINSDGANPQPGLLLSGNLLYGTARHGGSNGYGTVFTLPLATTLPELIRDTDSLSSGDPHAGDIVTVSLTITNQSCSGGSANAGAFHVGFYGLSTTSADLNTLAPFYEQLLSGCPANSTVSFKLDITIDTATTPGTYYLGYKINDENEVPMCNENSNPIWYWTLNVLPSLTVTPKLGAAPQGGSLILSWPTNSAGFTLQYATNLPSTNWNTVVPSPVIVNGQYTVTNATSGRVKFFRLLR